MPSGRQWTLVATIVGSSLTFVDATVVNVALPALQADLNASITDVQWVIEAYALFLGALILVGGSMGDQFGRKRVFLAGVVVFTLASVGCGLAGSTGSLIVARAVQGVGAAFLVPGSLAIISATFDDVDRGRAIGTWSGFSAITSAIGPVAGGWLIEHAGWRSVFFLNVPLAAIVIMLSARFMTESRDTTRTSRVDWAGAGLAVVGLGGVVFAFLAWPQSGASRTLVYATLGCGVASLAALVVVERRVAGPMLPLGLFRSRTFTLANLLTLFLYGVLMTAFWLVPLNLIQVQHYSAAAAGAAFLPFPVLMFLLSLVRRAGCPGWQPPAVDHRTDRRGLGAGALRTGGNRRLLLDHLLPSRRGARIGHGDRRGAAHHDRDDRGRGGARRGGIRREQRGRACRRSDCDRRVRHCVGPELRRARKCGARPTPTARASTDRCRS